MTAYDILSRGLQLEWHEAVALLCDVIERGALAERQAVPELDEVELLPTGHVEVHGGAHSDAPERDLVQLLRIMLGDALLPPELARVIEEPPASIESLSNALAYFERPRRETVLQEVYLRAAGSSPLPVADELIASMRGPSRSGGNRVPEVDEREADARSQPRGLYLAVGGAVVVVILLIGFVFLRTRGSAPSSADPSAASNGMSGVTAAVGNAVAAIGERVGLGNPPPAAPPQAADSSVPSPSPDSAAPSSPRASGARRERSPERPRDSSAIQPERPPSRGYVRPPNTVVPPLEERVVRASPAVDETVYSSASPDITPPLAIRPQLPKEPPPGVSPESLTRIQLVVGVDGRVESVKMVGQPVDILDSMLMSAAKAWQFRPALKDGVPVRYKTTVAISITRPR